MSKRTLVLAALLCALLSPMFTSLAWGQGLTSTPQSIVLAATKGESISVSAASPGTVTFDLNGTVTPGSATVTWTTNWDLRPSRSAVTVCVYLSANLTGTGANTDSIPPANVYGQADSAGSFLALTSNGCGQTGNALQVWTTTIDNSNRKNGSHPDTLNLQIDETTPLLSLSADTYSGTLNIVAQATP